MNQNHEIADTLNAIAAQLQAAAAQYYDDEIVTGYDLALEASELLEQYMADGMEQGSIEALRIAHAHAK